MTITISSRYLPIILISFLIPNLLFGYSDTSIIRSQLISLTKTSKARNYQNITQLNQSADFIKSTFSYYSDSVSYQNYQVGKTNYKNVICSFGTENKKRIIIGAHYDVCEDQQGADDNATGIVGLLELARLLQNKKLNYRIDLVAYTLEEPPFFRSEYMGSYIHAKSLLDSKIDVFGMISLEMIGYFKDEKKSQDYPLGILSLFYGNKGNYITLVNKFHAGKFAKKFTKNFKSTKLIRTKKFVGPASLTGIDFSDHLNYWKFGFSALMVSDTGFYRNKNYHQSTDTIETLDIFRMSKVIDGVYETLINMK
jgi:Zn-dependent M28 family amino/carboxypeptidase